eukprot:TRINITY_DN6151_c0_g1_i1.p1 TRINITY_DN6151_c0_g1~~TRINITY_DN6151_c0_g1_i1.p1  ORF type:complete len:124 (-),score=3.47 TRINITY_DN6151_c0_g1_i1:391-762(-)
MCVCVCVCVCVYVCLCSVGFSHLCSCLHTYTGDMRDFDFSDSTIVMSTNTVFGEELMAALTRTCEKNKNLKYLISQQPLSDDTSLRFLGEIRNVGSNWSFGDGVVYRVYTNLDGVEVPGLFVG